MIKCGSREYFGCGNKSSSNVNKNTKWESICSGDNVLIAVVIKLGLDIMERV